MRLAPGSRVGPYEIVAAIGAGGMGEVYRAIDQHLNRDVAIKVLPAPFAHDPERLARFEREARTLAALNHPHIAQVYGLVELPEAAAGRALVLEFVDGEDLSQRIARAGAIPIEDTLPIAHQVAEALEAAHAQGVIHRDLKPANIKARADGQVKVLDFGLAKALDAGSLVAGSKDPASAGADPANSPTITSPFQMSTLGVILGTAAYMAPEQAKGRPVDKRVDIWAFGCVLFEMLTATRAFAGEDVTDTLAAIVRADPDWSRLPGDTPANVRTLLRRCLEKDPRERLPDIGAARLELKDAIHSVPAPAPVAQTASRRAVLPWVLAGLGTLAAFLTAIGAVVRDATRPSTHVPVYKSIIVPPAPLTAAPVRRMQISPDGRRLAFVAPDSSRRTVLWVRPLDDAQAQPLRGTEGAAAPFWSPDSRWIAFQADGKIKKVEAAGGTVTIVGGFVDGPAGSWNRDNVILTTGGGNVIVRVPASGGAGVPVTVLRPETGEQIHFAPFFLPDGRHFLYAGARLGTLASTIYVGSIDTRQTTRLLEGASPRYANGYLLFLRGSMLMAQRFDPDRLAVSGEALPLAEDVQFNTTTGTGAYSVSESGELVFQAGAAVGSRLVWLDREGKPHGSLGDAGAYADVQLSPDGRWASASKSAEGHTDVWLFDVARGLPRKFTVDGTGGFDAVWRPDGARVAYAVRRGNNVDLVERAADGTGAAETLLSDVDNKVPIGFSPDGRFLLHLIQTGALRGRLRILGIADRTPRPLFPEEDPDQLAAEISPNGRWIAYTLVTLDGIPRLYIASFPEGSAKREITSGEAGTPHWRRDGKELFFTAPGKMMAVDVDPGGTTLETGVPHALFDVTAPPAALGMRSTYAVSPDGRQFLFNLWDDRSAAAPITLVVNWPQTLRR